MPNRILRDGILESKRVDLLTCHAELFYRRLMSVVDDYGRFYGEPELLRARCYPRRLDRVQNDDIAKWVTECVKAQLVALHDTESGPVIEMLDFRQQVRAKKSKFDITKHTKRR